VIDTLMLQHTRIIERKVGFAIHGRRHSRRVHEVY